MRTFICWLPAVIAFITLFFWSREKVVLNIYLPVLMLLPPNFHALTVGFPKLNFYQTTILPIFFFFLLKRSLSWRFSFSDLFVFGFIVWKFFSDLVNTDLSFAMNKTATALCSEFAPYVVFKSLIDRKDLFTSIFKRIIILVFFDVLISFIEAITTYNLHVNVISFLFFPGNYFYPVTRFGIARIAGPFLTPIFYGIVIGIALLLNYWLIKNQKWDRYFKWFPFIKKEKIIIFVLAIGLLLTLSRGPIIGFLLAFFVLKAGFSKKLILSFFSRISLVLICVSFLYLFFLEYTDITSSKDTEYNVAYRWTLLNVYNDFIRESPWFGWGSIPPLNEQFLSIDNAYLVILVFYGIGAFLFFTALILWVPVKLFFKAISFHHLEEKSLCMTMLSVFVLMILCFTIVYLGGQPGVLLFIFAGLSENLVLKKSYTEKIYDKA